MKKIINLLIKEEEGAVAVIAAISMTIILTFCALVVDFGFAYVKTAKIQNAADAATLAAGRMLPTYVDDDVTISQMKDTAILYAQKNEIDNLSYNDISFGDVVNGKYTSISVNIPCTMESYFAKIIGVDSFTFNRNAKARATPPTQMGGVAPLGVEYIQLNNAIENGETEHIYLKYGGGDGTQGSYGAIDLDGVQGGGANDYNYWLEYGYDGVIKVGDGLLPVEKGNMSGPTSSAIDVKYNSCTHFQGDGGCNAHHYDINCPRIIKILVIEKIGTKYISVKGFAAFVIEGESGSNAEVIGSYIKFIEPGELNKNADWNSTDYGVYNIGLSY